MAVYLRWKKTWFQAWSPSGYMCSLILYNADFILFYSVYSNVSLCKSAGEPCMCLTWRWLRHQKTISSVVKQQANTGNVLISPNYMRLADESLRVKLNASPLLARENSGLWTTKMAHFLWCYYNQQQFPAKTSQLVVHLVDLIILRGKNHVFGKYSFDNGWQWKGNCQFILKVKTKEAFFCFEK